MDDLVLVTFFLVLGLFTGFAAGMLGIGGGIILVPSLFYSLPLIGVGQNSLAYTVIGTSLFCGTFASFSSAVTNYINNNIDKHQLFLFAIGSVLASSIAPLFVVKINSSILKVIFGTVLILVVIKMLFEINQKEQSSFHISEKYLPFLGIFTGTLAGMTGIGGGVLFVPILTYFYAVNLKRSIGTSSAVIFFTMLSSAISYGVMKTGTQSSYQLGFINFFAGVPISIGAMVGAVFGVKVVHKTPIIVVKRIFSLFLIIIILRMMIYQ